jgi:NADH:ubiquinone oxidoreductase subunit 6 (subunit J)
MPPVLSDPSLQLLLAVVLAAVGVFLLLPRPQGRSVALGSFLGLAALGIFGAFLQNTFGNPVGQWLPDLLFGVFATLALVFGTIFITQRNPARGAIAFAFVILSTCGLFLLLAAPFLMAATVIIYAGAIIVTFLFVLMLSHVAGPSDENDRSREPMLGSLAGLAFVGLIGFTLMQSGGIKANANESVLPQPPLTTEDRAVLDEVRKELDQALANDDAKEVRRLLASSHDKLNTVVGGEFIESNRKTVPDRLLPVASDPRTISFLKQTDELRKLADKTDDETMNNFGNPTAIREAIKPLRDRVVIYSGNGQLPARNVANLGYILYSEHILAVELAGTLLLVATIGAVAIAQRRKDGSA